MERAGLSRRQGSQGFGCLGILWVSVGFRRTTMRQGLLVWGKTLHQDVAEGGVLLGSLGFRCARLSRDMGVSISRRGVPPYLPLLSFPLYATFVSVSSTFGFLVLVSSLENIPAVCQTSIPDNP